MVSYVINNGPRAVAPSTAARVHRAIELLDYRPNVSAQALRRGTAQVLGLIVLDPVNPFFTELRGRDGARRVGGIGLPLSAVRDRPGDPAVLRV